VTRRVLALAAVIALSGCSLDHQGAPPLAGPSELGLSLDVTATPDVIAQDGQSQAVVQVLARDANSQPVSGLAMRVDTSVGGALADFGRLSTHTASTGSDGKATVTYYAPSAPPATATNDTTVSVVVTPIGSNYANALPRTVQIHLMRPGTIISPLGTPTAKFIFSPTSPKEEDEVLFDASTSTDSDGQIVSYRWDFGDGETGSGVRITHSYVVARAYQVVLTVTDNQGLSASTAPTTVTVAAADGATASFTFSPSTPLPDQDVFFNAASSKVPPDRTIRSFDWDFGDGSPHASGVSVSHQYHGVASYTVTLTMTDDTGRTFVTAQTVTVADPTAALKPTFTVSPGSPFVDQDVFFNAAASTVPEGRTIAAYSWDFGDGSPHMPGSTQTHQYSLEGQYTVTLRITDNTGESAVTSQTISVSSAKPQADFTFSPTAPTTNDGVHFNAATSMAMPGRSIVTYSWDFGDGATDNGPNVTHGPFAAGTWQVTLTVTDDHGDVGTARKSVTVTVPTP
jgi:PKD repeat protein